MRITKYLAFLTLLFPVFLYGQPQPQPLHTKSKKAIAAYEVAMNALGRKDYDLALYKIENAINADKDFIEAHMIQGEIYSELKSWDKAIIAYKSANAIDPKFFPANNYNIANYSLKLGDYLQAKEYFLKYLAIKYIPAKHRNVCENGLAVCEFGIYAMAHPKPFNPKNLGENINSEYDDFINAISTDETTLILTVKHPKEEQTSTQKNQEEEDFYFSKKVDDNWGKAYKIGAPFNSSGNEGAMSISPDGSFMIFTGCYRPDGFGSCDLYISQKIGEQWSVPVNMGEKVNSSNWDTHATISSDGRTVYFISNRPGSLGGSDIWKTVMDENGKWVFPVNLGNVLNTPKNEYYPFIHPDNQTMYYSSDGHLGMGGTDLFYTRKDINGNWAEPVNMGYPINSHLDELGILINAKGELAYFSSNKLGGKGRYDIYSFNLYKEARPISVNYLKGKVFDSYTLKKLKASFELIDLSLGNVVVKSASDKITGEFFVCIPSSKNYALNVSADGYLFYSDNFSIDTAHSFTNPFIKDVPLQLIKKGEVVVLRNIFFDTDKFDLKPESRVELERLTILLNQNNTLKIEISGHTDAVGSEEHNLILSNNRAKAVYTYLIENGIVSNRLSFKGYGKSLPIDTNETPQGRANNRRTEFRIVDL